MPIVNKVIIPKWIHLCDSEAIAEYLARHSPDTITDDLNRVADRLGQQDVVFVRMAAKGVLAKDEW